MSAPGSGLKAEAGKQLNEYLLELRLPAIRRTVRVNNFETVRNEVY